MGFLGKTQSMGLAAVILAASTVLSRFMGLIRDKVVSWQFGAGSEADMYFAAFVVPDVINYLLAGGFMSITLIPLLSKALSEDEADGWRFFSCAVTWMGIAAVVLTSLGSLFALPLAHVTAPGLAPHLYDRLAFFMRLVLPAQCFFLTGSCFVAVLYLRRQFLVPALAPLIYNGFIIAAGLILPTLGLVQGMTGYCIGVTIGAAVGTFCLPLIALKSGGLPYGFRLSHPLMKKFLLLALPLMLGQTVAALDEQFLRVFGSLAGDGSVSLLNYAKRVSQVPVALVGQAAAVASYPFLVSLLTKGDREGFTKTFSNALRSAAALIVPIALWMVCLSDSTFTLLFHGGRMAAGETLRAVPLLQILLAGTPCWIIYALLVRGFYAKTDTLTPAVVGTLLTIVFVPAYYWLAVPAGAWGIALCSALSMLAYTVILALIWIRRNGGAIFAGLLPAAFLSGVCAIPGCVGGWFVDHLVRGQLAGMHPVLSAFVGLACAGGVFLVTFCPLFFRFCPAEADIVLGRLARRFRKK